MPRVQIKYNQFLDPIFLTYFQQRFKLSLLEEIEQKEVDFIVSEYKKAWSAVEKKVLESIQDITKLSFKNALIDVHVVRRTNRSFSRPPVFDIRKNPSDFCDELIHELIHIILQQNNSIVSWGVLEWLNEKFSEETDCTRNHLYVHAILKILYLDVLEEPKRLERNLARSKKHSTNEYTRAWDIVDSVGEKEIIMMIKKNYEN